MAPLLAGVLLLAGRLAEQRLQRRPGALVPAAALAQLAGAGAG
jgi:hypothetical protein